VLAYHLFLGDSRSGPRLLSGLTGLATYTALHAASALTGPFHEALLVGQPRLLFRWRRAVEAWRYGSGADWAPHAAAAAAAEGRQPEQQRPATPAGGMVGGLDAAADGQLQQQGGLGQSVVHAVPLATAGPPRGPIVAFGAVNPDSAAAAAAAAAAEGASEEEGATAGLKAVVDADWLWDVTHSVDTHEDAMAEGWEAPGPAAAAAAAALQSEDTHEDALLMEGLRLSTSSSSSKRHEAAVAGAVEQFTALGSSAAAAAAAGKAAVPRGGPVEWSVDTYEDSLLEDSSSSMPTAAAGPQQGDSGDWYATHSQDNNEDSLMDGWDMAPAAAATPAAAAAGDAGDPSKWSVDTYEDSMLKGVAAAAVSEAEWDATHSQDNNEEDLLGPASTWGNPKAAAGAGTHPRGVSGDVAGDAVIIGGVAVSPVYHSQDTYEEDLLAAAAGVDVVVTPPAAAPGADAAAAGREGSTTAGTKSSSGTSSSTGARGGPVVGFLVVKQAESADQADSGAQESEGDVYPGPVAEGCGAMAAQSTPAGSGSSSTGSQAPSKRSAGSSSSSSSSPPGPQQGSKSSKSSSSGQQRGAGEGAPAPKPGSWRGTWRPHPGGGKGSRRLSDLEQGPDEGV
jgi:hypothetical protein